jgi:hypothetical protein
MNHKRLLWTLLSSDNVQRKKRKRYVREASPVLVRNPTNQVCAPDFVCDAVESDRTIRVLNVLDARCRRLTWVLEAMVRRTRTAPGDSLQRRRMLTIGLSR